VRHRKSNLHSSSCCGDRDHPILIAFCCRLHQDSKSGAVLLSHCVCRDDGRLSDRPKAATKSASVHPESPPVHGRPSLPPRLTSLMEHRSVKAGYANSGWTDADFVAPLGRSDRRRHHPRHTQWEKQGPAPISNLDANRSKWRFRIAMIRITPAARRV